MRFGVALMWVGAPCEIIWYFYERSQGYWDSLPIRTTLSLIMISLGLIDWKSLKGKLPILYWEFSLFMVVPFQSTMALLHNHSNDYYFTSQCAMFFLLGMLTKVWMVPIHLLVGAGFTTALYFFTHGWDYHAFAASLPAQVNGLFCGMMSGAIMIVMENNHKKITAAKVELAKADEEKAKAAEVAKAYAEVAKAYADLKQREELIRVYVRPSLVDEIHTGKDPSKAPPVLRNLSIMFCDIREFTRLTEVLTPYERQAFLNEYFTMMTHPIVERGARSIRSWATA